MMNTFFIFLTGLSLAMDAFAVSICKGLSSKKINLKLSLTVGFYFGLFQMLMPIIGYFLAYKFTNLIINIDHWIVFIILGIIGFNMILEATKCENIVDSKIDFKTMIALSIATSIDALAVGISFAFLEVNIFTAAIFIGLITFLVCALGVKIGSIFGNKYEKISHFLGGIVLILIGLKILLEHLGII